MKTEKENHIHRLDSEELELLKGLVRQEADYFEKHEMTVGIFKEKFEFVKALLKKLEAIE